MLNGLDMYYRSVIFYTCSITELTFGSKTSDYITLKIIRDRNLMHLYHLSNAYFQGSSLFDLYHAEFIGTNFILHFSTFFRYYLVEK